MKTERVALYARVSTLVGQNPEMQVVELRECAPRRGWIVVDEYVAHGVSGAKESRPALFGRPTASGRSLRDLVNALASVQAQVFAR